MVVRAGRVALATGLRLPGADSWSEMPDVPVAPGIPGRRLHDGVRVIAAPYHLDEYLSDLDFPLSADEVVTTDLPPGDVWDRLADALRGLLGSGLVAAVGLACTWYAGHDAAARVVPALEAGLAGI